MSGLNCRLIVCILAVLYVREQDIQLSRKGRIHVDAYMWTLDKPTASLSAAI